jgi:hypothetical protein
MKFTTEEKEKILVEFQKRLTKSVTSREQWLQQEVIEGYSIVESGGQFGQWAKSDWNFQRDSDMPVSEVNRINPIVRAVSGFQIQNRLEIAFTPRKMGEESQGFASMADKGYRFIVKDSGAQYENSRAFKDALVCGVGFVHTRISHDNNLNGEADVNRVFPAFVFWDASARQKNLKDSNWFSVVSVKDKSAEGYVDEEGEETDEYKGTADTTGIATGDDQILRFFSYTNTADTELSIEHDYQWRSKEDVYRIENPLLEEDALREDLLNPDLSSLGIQGNPLLDYLGKYSRGEYGLDVEDRVWYFDKAGWRRFKADIKAQNEMLAMAGIMPIELEKPLKQKKWVYYRATICRGVIKDISKNISQEQFSVTAMTGEYSETDQMFFGLVRNMKSPQRGLNQTLADFQTYIRSNPRGGIIMETDATDDPQGFANTYLLGRDVSFVNSGALAAGKVMPKPVSPLANGVLELIAYFGDAIMTAAGVTPEFMGQMSSKDMTGALQGQIIRQTLTMLSEFQDGYSQFLHNQARLFVDCLRVMAENEDGRVLPNIGGKEKEKHFELMYDPFMVEYDVEISETPQLPNERQMMANKLWDMAAKMIQLQDNRGSNLIPIALEFENVTAEVKGAIQQAMQPPPPPQPDPIQQALLDSQSKDLYASAGKKQAETQKVSLEAAKLEQELNINPQTDLAALGKMQADIDYTKAKTMNELGNIGAKNV